VLDYLFVEHRQIQLVFVANTLFLEDNVVFHPPEIARQKKNISIFAYCDNILTP